MRVCLMYTGTLKLSFFFFFLAGLKESSEKEFQIGDGEQNNVESYES